MKPSPVVDIRRPIVCAITCGTSGQVSSEYLAPASSQTSILSGLEAHITRKTIPPRQNSFDHRESPCRHDSQFESRPKWSAKTLK